MGKMLVIRKLYNLIKFSYFVIFKTIYYLEFLHFFLLPINRIILSNYVFVLKIFLLQPNTPQGETKNNGFFLICRKLKLKMED